MYTTSINLSPPAAPLWAFVSQHLFLSTSQKILRGSCWSVPQCSSSLLSSWRQPWYFQSNFQLQTHANSLSLYIFIAHCCIEEWNWKEKCEILAQKKYKSTSATNPTTFSLHIVHFHCTLLHWRMKLEGRNAKYWPKRNTSQQPEQIQLYFKPPERWPNEGRTVRRL